MFASARILALKAVRDSTTVSTLVRLPDSRLRVVVITFVVPSGMMLMHSPFERRLPFHVGDTLTVRASVIAYASGARETLVTFTFPPIVGIPYYLIRGTLSHRIIKSLDYHLLSPLVVKVHVLFVTNFS